MPRYPGVVPQLDLDDPDCTAVVIVARVAKALRGAGVSWEVIGEFREAAQGDRVHALAIAREWVDV